MDFSEHIKQDILKVFKSMQYNDFLDQVVGRGYKENIEKMNDFAVQPNGSLRFDLQDDYAEYKVEEIGGKDQRDLNLMGRRERNFTYFPDTGRSNVRFGYSKPEVAEYMYIHEHGTNDMPEARQFPVESDHSNVQMAESADINNVNIEHLANNMAAVVYKGLEDVLNHDRTININM